MKKTLFIKALIATFMLLSMTQVFAQKKEIAITIDDLPFVGEYRNFHLNMIITTLTEQRVAATGFIIAKEVKPNSWKTLKKFRDAGLSLGNHTFSHANLNQLDTQDYIDEIRKADNILKPVLTKPKYFRYPYLAMSSGSKRDDILCYLSHKKYRVAPITIDSKDFLFNQRLLATPEIARRTYFEELKPFYLDFIQAQTLNAEAYNQRNHREEQAQILLIHANLLNAYVLPEIIKQYRENGYTFVSLEDALKTFPDSYHCKNTSYHTTPAAEKPPVTSLNNKPDADPDVFVEWDQDTL